MGDVVAATAGNEPAAYLLLLRLALVRYQPHAIDACAVSRVVLVDLVQTPPERTLTVTQAADEPAARRVTVVGPRCPRRKALAQAGPAAGRFERVSACCNLPTSISTCRSPCQAAHGDVHTNGSSD